MSKTNITIGCFSEQQDDDLLQWIVFHAIAWNANIVVGTPIPTDAFKDEVKRTAGKNVKIIKANRPFETLFFAKHTGKTLFSIFLDKYEYLFATDKSNPLAEHKGDVKVDVFEFEHNNHVHKPDGLIIDNFVTRKPAKESITREARIKSRSSGPVTKIPKIRIHYYFKRDMASWVERHKLTGDHETFGLYRFNDIGELIVDRSACRHSMELRKKLGLHFWDATVDNTVFISSCDYPNPGHISEPLRLTAEYFGIPLTWASYGKKWINFVHTKYVEGLAELKRQMERGKEYVFFFDSRDVIFANPVEKILHDFNLIYRGGVLYNADLENEFYPVSYGAIRNRILYNYDKNRIANGGLCAGKIKQIIKLWERLLGYREEIVSMNYQTEAIRLIALEGYLHNFRHNEKIKLADDDQFLLHLDQMRPGSEIFVDGNKELFAFHGNGSRNEYPNIWNRKEIHVYDRMSIGEASIFHSPWTCYEREQQPNRKTYLDWIKNHVMQGK